MPQQIVGILWCRHIALALSPLIISKMGDRTSPQCYFFLKPDGVSIRRTAPPRMTCAYEFNKISAETRPPRRAGSIIATVL